MNVQWNVTMRFIFFRNNIVTSVGSGMVLDLELRLKLTSALAWRGVFTPLNNNAKICCCDTLWAEIAQNLGFCSLILRLQKLCRLLVSKYGAWY